MQLASKSNFTPYAPTHHLGYFGSFRFGITSGILAMMEIWEGKIIELEYIIKAFKTTTYQEQYVPESYEPSSKWVLKYYKPVR